MKYLELYTNNCSSYEINTVAFSFLFLVTVYASLKFLSYLADFHCCRI